VVVAYAAHLDCRTTPLKWIVTRGPDDLNILTKPEADSLGIVVDLYDEKPTAGPQDRTRVMRELSFASIPLRQRD